MPQSNEILHVVNACTADWNVRGGLTGGGRTNDVDASDAIVGSRIDSGVDGRGGVTALCIGVDALASGVGDRGGVTALGIGVDALGSGVGPRVRVGDWDNRCDGSDIVVVVAAVDVGRFFLLQGLFEGLLLKSYVDPLLNFIRAKLWENLKNFCLKEKFRILFTTNDFM